MTANARRNQLITLASFGLVAVLGLAWLSLKSFQEKPAFSDLPYTWFERPIHGDPAAWRLPGAADISVEAKGPVLLRVIPEDRADVAAELQASPDAAPAVLPGAGRGPIAIGSGGKAPCPLVRPSEAPVLTLRTPRKIAVRTAGPVWAEVGPAQGLLVSSLGCSTWRIEAADTLWLALDGQGRVDAARGHDVRVAITGPGAVTLARSDDRLDSFLNGPGRLTVGKVQGPVDVEVWGRGRVELGSGFVANAHLFIKGPGQILVRGAVGNVTAEARVGGKVRVAQVRGVASGIGDVEMGQPGHPIAAF